MKWIVLVSCLLEPARAKNEWMPLPFRPGDVHPGARHGQSTVMFTHLTYNQRLALIFGGVSREAQYLNDVWLFNVTDERWYQASTDGGLAQTQAARHNRTHASECSCAIPPRMALACLSGVQLSQQSYSVPEWTTRQDSPEGRMGHQTALYSDNRTDEMMLSLFGGICSHSPSPWV